MPLVARHHDRSQARPAAGVLPQAPGAASFDEAFTQLANVLNAVEDELTDVPYDPESWREDGRIYPPQPDNLRKVPGHPHVVRFRSRKHSTYVGMNGSIEIV